MADVSVLFVCLGNICRSPTAEGVFRARASARGLGDRLRVDSCGTAGYHVGEPPDARTREAAARRGYDLSKLRARQLAAADLTSFDYVLCADRDNLQAVTRMAASRPSSSARVGLFLEWGASDEDEIPDPYYGGRDGFERVLDLCEEASDGLLDELQARLR